MKRIALLFFTLFFAVSSHAETAAINQNKLTDKPEVQTFIAEMVSKYKFKKSELVTLFNQVRIKTSAEKSIKAPFEIKPWYVYRHAFINRYDITEGVAFWTKNRDILEKAEKMYGIPASIIVATIGVETGYGKSIGNYRVIDALVTLAFGNTTRTKYFRSELSEFLLLTREQHLDPLTVMGSYAGAIGQPQFMPSSFRNYAVSFSGNPKIDLTHNEADIIGSIANYYNKNGWLTNQPAAIPASISGGKYQFSFSHPKPISIEDLLAYGQIPDKQFLNNSSESTAKIIALQTSHGHEYWLAFHNFDVIKRYNPSNMYAMAVYQLSVYISALREKLRLIDQANAAS